MVTKKAVIKPEPDYFYPELDRIAAAIQRHAKPELIQELRGREGREVSGSLSDSVLLEKLAQIIAYSQGAKSKLVDKMLKEGCFNVAFAGFDIDKVSEMNPCLVVDSHWNFISSIRQKTKIFQIVMAARSIKKNGGLCQLWNESEIPTRIHTLADIENFWRGFETLQSALKLVDVPFLHSTTSLLHFMLHIGYDCIKPDTIVVQVAQRLKMGSGNTDKQLKDIVQIVQQYALRRKIRPSLVDLYMLIDGRQTWAEDFVDPTYYDAQTS